MSALCRKLPTSHWHCALVTLSKPMLRCRHTPKTVGVAANSMIGKASERFLVGLLQEISSRVEAYSWPWPASQHLGMKARGRVGSGARERGVGTQPPLDRERVPQTWLSLDKKLKKSSRRSSEILAGLQPWQHLHFYRPCRHRKSGYLTFPDNIQWVVPLIGRCAVTSFAVR